MDTRPLTCNSGTPPEVSMKSVSFSASMAVLLALSHNALGANTDSQDMTGKWLGVFQVYPNFVRFDGTNWAQTSYVKASNPEKQVQFGRVIALNADGTTLVVGPGPAAAEFTCIEHY